MASTVTGFKYYREYIVTFEKNTRKPCPFHKLETRTHGGNTDCVGKHPFKLYTGPL